MDKQREITKVHNIVKDILTKDEQARNSDNYLYTKVVERLNANALEKPFEEVMINLNNMGLPCFETVRRSRCKIQAKYPELQSCDKVHSLRSINEEIMKEYARS